MPEQVSRNRSAAAKAAILSMSVVQMGTTAISPILADIGAAFPEAGTSTVQFLMTFPSLFVVVVSLLAAGLARSVPKKWIAAAGCGLFVVSGILSWQLHSSLTLLFVWAAVMGTGIGLVVPMATSLVSDCFTGLEQQIVMGWQSSAANIGAVLMTFAGGLLAAIHWSCNYLVYLIAAPGLVLSLTCLDRDPGGSKTIEKEGPQKGGLAELLGNGQVLVCCAAAVLVTMLFNVIPANLSMYVAERGLGGPAEAGTGTALLLIGGTLGGLCFGKLSALLKRRVMAFGFGMLMAGLGLLAIAPGMPVVYVSCLMAGTCISIVMPQVLLEMASHANGNTGLTSALAMAASNLGSFATPLLTVAAQAVSGTGDVQPRLYLGAGCAAVVCAALAILLPNGSQT